MVSEEGRSQTQFCCEREKLWEGGVKGFEVVWTYGTYE